MATISEWLARASSSWLVPRVSRRGFLMQAAVVGSALAVKPVDYVLHPGTAYDSVCGSDGGSCSAGYSVMCCSVTGGVNECPPGTFPGGWWKAVDDGLCGGGSRYYIDCQAECTHCSSGCNPFCDSGCWDCGCHCHSGNTCDHRRECCNVFRYGQCNEQVPCTGPVMCRQISCRPPYEWLPCSSVTAVDDSTATHTAPCLPGWDPIEVRYYELGGPASFLGTTIDGSYRVLSGIGQKFTGGRMYWSRTTGAHPLSSAILGCYLAPGVQPDLLLPISDELVASDRKGRYMGFQRGVILWSSTTGAHSVSGDINALYHHLGDERSALGYPTSNEEQAHGGGVYNDFQHGVILSNSHAGTHEIHGPIYTKWRALGGTYGRLRFPTSNQFPIRDRGVRNDFQGGWIAYYPRTHKYLVKYT